MVRWRWSGSRPPDRHPPPSRYPTRVRVFLSLPFCSLLCEHNSLAEDTDSLVFLWSAQRRFYNRRGGQSVTYDVPQGVAGQLPRRTKLQRVLRRVSALSAVVTDVRRFPSDFPQVLAKHAVSREHLDHPVGEREAAVASLCLLVWEDRLRASMFASLVDQLGLPLIPRVFLGKKSGKCCRKALLPYYKKVFFLRGGNLYRHLLITLCAERGTQGGILTGYNLHDS